MNELMLKINNLAKLIERTYGGEDIKLLKPELEFFSDFLGFKLTPSEENNIGYVDAIYGHTVNHLVTLAEGGQTEDCEDLILIFTGRLEEY